MIYAEREDPANFPQCWAPTALHTTSEDPYSYHITYVNRGNILMPAPIKKRRKVVVLGCCLGATTAFHAAFLADGGQRSA